MRVDSLIGAQLAQYRIEDLIGEGGMSRVYRAEHVVLRKKVALKLLAADLADDDAFRERFLRESQLAASLDHPNVIEIYDAGEADGRLYIAMRYIVGTDLRAMVKQTGALEPERALSILAQVAAALDAAHGHGLVHRDVKPANVLIGAREHVYLSDFGVAKYSADARGLTRTGFFVGTLDYAAPEQIRGEHLDGRADVYALGCLLYQCLSGQLPYPRDSEVQLIYAHLEEPIPSLAELGFPVRLDRVIATALAKDRAERYPTCGQLISAARTALTYARPARAPAATPPPPEPAPEPASPTVAERAVVAEPPVPVAKGRRRSPILAVVAGAAALLAAAVLAAVFLRDGGDGVVPLVAGRVTDFRTGKPLAGVRVRADGPSAVTKRDGRFALRNVSAGEPLVFENCAYARQEAEPSRSLAVALRPRAVAGTVKSGLTGAGIRATIAGKTRTTTRPLEGTFTLFGSCPGDTVVFSAPGHKSLRARIPGAGTIAAVLPAIAVAERFSSPKASLFGPSKRPEAETYAADGGYHVVVHRRNWAAIQLVRGDKPIGDATVEVATRRMAGSPQDGFGVVCRWDAAGRYYLLEVSSDGFARIGKRSGDRFVTLRDWEATSAVRRSGANRISATCSGNGAVELVLSANGSPIARASDPRGLPAGRVGLAASRYGNRETHIVFDNFRLRRV